MKNKLILLIIVAIIIAGGVFAYQYFKGQGEDVSPEIVLTEEQEVENFVASYLTAYSSVYENENFDEVKEFIAPEVLAQMIPEGTPFETSATDFNEFEILEMVKANHEPYAPDVLGWEVQVKLIKDSTEESVTISVIKDNGTSTSSVSSDGWKTTSWYFGE